VAVCEPSGLNPQATQGRMIESAFQRVASEIPYQGVTSIVRHLIAVEALVTKQRDDARAGTLDLRYEPEKLSEHTLYWGNALLTAKEAGAVQESGSSPVMRPPMIASTPAVPTCPPKRLP
jgi:hypothetical protein